MQEKDLKRFDVALDGDRATVTAYGLYVDNVGHLHCNGEGGDIGMFAAGYWKSWTLIADEPS